MIIRIFSRIQRTCNVKSRANLCIMNSIKYAFAKKQFVRFNYHLITIRHHHYTQKYKFMLFVCCLTIILISSHELQIRYLEQRIKSLLQLLVPVMNDFCTFCIKQNQIKPYFVKNTIFMNFILQYYCFNSNS